MKHNSKSTLTTKYSAGEQIVMDRNVSLRYNKKHHIMEEKVMGKRKSVLKTATAAALTGLVLTSVSPAYAGTLPVPAASEESDTTTPQNGWSADGLYWYEDGVLQGLNGRGKEIYDPASDAWYWLDAAYCGKKAVSKDVYQESWAGAYADREDGTGKWVRYDENGHMVKGWDETENGKYYFDLETGAMAKGEAVIDGTTYVFDETTGIMKNTGWYTADGNEYWCEDGIKQGLEGRGKEIYDPETDAWYWLDAADNGKKAVSKDVYQESESDGGKWVRYDEDGKMVKGWDLNMDGLYYFAPVTGEMSKETVNINGASYQFDGVTGTSISVEYPVAELNQESDGQRFIDSSKESLVLDGDTWHCYKDGQIDYEYDGIALNEYGWWKVNDGTVDFNYTGMVQNENGWWYVNNGCVDWTYSGMALNKYGWWKYNNGFVDFGYTGIALNEYGWWKFTNGSVDFNANGLVFDEATNTWWYFNGGAIDFAFDGMALNDYGWWKVNNGSVNFGFNGLCSNEYGTWKFNGGTVDFGYNGFAADGENTWYVVNGRVATEYSGTVDGKEVRNGQVMDTIVIQVVHHDRDRTGAVTEGNPDTSGLVGYIEYLTVPVDKEGNITEPVYVPDWKPDDYKGFTSGYIITCSSMLADGTGIHVKEEAQRTDIRPYIKDGVLNLYMSWFMM